MIDVRTLQPERWREARELRLQALQTDPIAFGSAYEEEENFPEEEWQRRMKNAIFALSDDRPVGTITYVFSNRVKSKHIARIFAFYVEPNYRNRGIGKKLLERALELIRENKEIVKIQLFVNREQEAAVKLYKKMGFVIVGQMNKEIKIGDSYYDEFIMEKMLTP
jgi:ribosomal protein S18 acetylase RimI-like enzyme